MRYRRLGRTGILASVVGVGTWQFGGEWGHPYTQPEADSILDAAAEHGINLIDTAECYGDHLSETLIGDYLSRRKRDLWVVATKFGHQYHKFMDRSWRLSPADVQSQLEASLRALRTEAIDLYQFHSGSNDLFQQPELWAMLEREKQAGKIRHLGISISSKGDGLQAREAHAVGAAVLQVLYNRLDRRAETDFFPYAEQYDLGVLARVPLASGLLSGKYTAASQFGPGDVRTTFNAEDVRRQIGEVESLRTKEVPAGVSMARWALAWCLKQPVVTCVIPGCRDAAQVEQNARAADL